VQIGAPKQPGGRGRRRAAVAKPPPATVVGKGDET
jgi:hypothetical protein